MERTAKSAPEEIALGLFEQGFTCGQAVLAAFADLSRAMRRLLLLLLATCACVSAPMARRDLDLRAKILEPSRDAAKLYVYRPGGFVGAGVAVQVFVDEARVGVLKAGTFLAVTLRPGEHAILVRTMGEARQTIVVELGRNYYVRADAAWGWSHPEASVEVIRDERAATEAVRECALVTSLAAEQLRRVATDLADTVVELVGAEALVKEATRALAVMGGNDPSTVPELDEAVDRLRSSRPGVLDNDVVLAGARAMLDMLEPQGTKATRDTTRAIDPSCGLVLRSSGGATVVAAVLPESPAASARVEPGVEIREIDGRLTRDRTPAELVRLLAGAPGTDAAVTVGRPGEADRKVVLHRSPRDETALDCRVIEDRVLYLRPWLVTSAAARRVRDDARAVPGAARLVVLDLRDTEGGQVAGAAELADSFLTSGTILSLDGARVSGVNRVYTATPGTSLLEDAQVVVLVNGHTGVTAEGVAAALQDGRRATLLGSRTAGIGVVYTWETIAGLRLYIPTARLVRAGGQPIAGRGVTPDVLEGAAAAEAPSKLRDVACPGVASTGAVAGDELVVRAVRMLLAPTAARSAAAAP